jgi:large subunit ribosomal protein L6
MSRVGKQQLVIPTNTQVVYTEGVLRVTGPLGMLEKPFKDVVTITIADGLVVFAQKGDDPFARAIWGTYASHVKNMIAGVNTPYTKKLILEGGSKNSRRVNSDC